MAMNPPTDTDCLNLRADDDDDEGEEEVVIKRENVEEEEEEECYNYKQGKRKYYVVKNDKTSQTNNNNKKKKKKAMKLSPSKSKNHGTSHSAGKGKFLSCKLEKIQANGICGPGQVKSPAIIRAEHVRSSLGIESPSFSKLVLKSHVGGSFCMTIPASFCRSHLPINDTVITLEDESEKQFEVKYFPKWTGLSGGWRNFSVRHKLHQGDVLVFHLVAPTKFKVYIIRANDLSEVEGAPTHLNSDTHAKQNGPGENLDSDDKEDTPTTNDSEVHSEFSERSKSSKPTNCKGLETFKDFRIMVNGLCVESELQENTRKKYYELCCSKNAILHDHLIPGLNGKLVSGIISETINIADAIKACNFATSRDELEQWEKSLKSFELLGMNFGFLLNRLSQLLKLAFESERARFEDEIKNLEVKRLELKEAYEKIGGDIEKLKSKAERQHLKFQEVVNSPWYIIFIASSYNVFLFTFGEDIQYSCSTTHCTPGQ